MSEPGQQAAPAADLAALARGGRINFLGFCVRLAARLAEIESAGSAAARSVGEAQASFSGTLETLLERASVSLDEIRSGIDAQAAAVAALVEQASAGIGNDRSSQCAPSG